MYDDRVEITSPGGMFEGGAIQNKDIDEVTSARRNPVIADLFHRMRYMERRGSGLHKIVAETEKLPGYTEELKPRFVSTDSTFKVVLMNVNYKENLDIDGINDGVNDGVNSKNDGVNDGVNSKNDGVKLNSTQKKIIEMMRKNDHCTIDEMAEFAQVKRRAIERNIKSLRERDLILRDGADKNGRWVVKI